MFFLLSGVPRPQLSSQQSNHRMAAAQRMLTRTNATLQRLDNPAESNPSDNSAPPPTQEQPQDPGQEQEQQEQDQELEE